MRNVGKTLGPTTRTRLERAEITGPLLRLGEQMDPAEYAPVAAVLDALGGRWTRSVGAHVFPAGFDVAAAVAGVLAAGTEPLPARTADGFVPTPDGLAEDLMGYPYSDIVRLPAGAVVLEPSAGDGAIVRAILDANEGVHVVAVESDPGRARALEALAVASGRVTVVCDTIEAYTARCADDGTLFDGCLMNPPWAVPGRAFIWAEHIETVWPLLRDGARLVALVPRSYEHRDVSAIRRVRSLVAAHGGGSVRVPAGAFAMAACAVWAARPVPVPAGRARYEFRPYSGAEVPVRVAEPRVTAEAVTAAPVQVWYDGWRRQDRVLRFRCECAGCGWLLWGFDDGENSPLGVLGDWAAWSQDAYEDDMAGPTAGMCTMCANTYERYEPAMERIRALWTPVNAPVPVVAGSALTDGEALDDWGSYAPDDWAAYV